MGVGVLTFQLKSLLIKGISKGVTNKENDDWEKKNCLVNTGLKCLLMGYSGLNVYLKLINSLVTEVLDDVQYFESRSPCVRLK